jgi:hypothetical protein
MPSPSFDKEVTPMAQFLRDVVVDRLLRRR